MSTAQVSAIDSQTNSPVLLSDISVIRDELLTMIDKLPASTLITVKQFVAFLSTQPETQLSEGATQTLRGRHVIESDTHNHPYLYPTIGVPIKDIDEWAGKFFDGYDGDSLEDSEALYDDV